MQRKSDQAMGLMKNKAVTTIKALTKAELLKKMTDYESLIFGALHEAIDEGKNPSELNEAALLRSTFFTQLLALNAKDVSEIRTEAALADHLNKGILSWDNTVDAFCQEKKITRAELLADKEPIFKAFLSLCEALYRQRYFLSQLRDSENAKALTDDLNQHATSIREAMHRMDHVEAERGELARTFVEAEDIANVLVHFLKKEKELALKDAKIRKYVQSSPENHAAISQALIMKLQVLPRREAIDVNKIKEDSKPVAKNQAQRVAECLEFLNPSASQAQMVPTLTRFKKTRVNWEGRLKEASATGKKLNHTSMTDMDAKIDKILFDDIQDNVTALIAAMRPLTPYLGRTNHWSEAIPLIEKRTDKLKHCFQYYHSPFMHLRKKYQRYAQKLEQYSRWVGGLKQDVDAYVAAEALVSGLVNQACRELTEVKEELDAVAAPAKYQFLRFFGGCCVLPEAALSRPEMRDFIPLDSFSYQSSFKFNPEGQPVVQHEERRIPDSFDAMKSQGSIEIVPDHSQDLTEEEPEQPMERGVFASLRSMLPSTRRPGQGFMTKPEDEPLVPAAAPPRRAFGRGTNSKEG